MKNMLVAIGFYAMAVSSSGAAPFYTAYFEGVTTYFWSYNANAYDGSRVGLPLSGYYTFDLSNGYATANHDQSGNLIGVGQQASLGCIWNINGSCLASSEGNPVITAYSVVTPFAPPRQIRVGAPPALGGGYEAFDQSLNYGDGSAISQSEREGVQTYSASRDQLRRNIFAQNGGYDLDEILRSFSVFLQSDTDFLYASLEDLTAAPHLSDADINNSLFFRDSRDTSRCADWRDTSTCAFTGWEPDSFYFFGRLTSLTVVAGPATPRRLPEPGTCALLAGCLTALILTGTRKPIAA